VLQCFFYMHDVARTRVVSQFQHAQWTGDRLSASPKTDPSLSQIVANQFLITQPT
jgi:hypothetical protein